MGMTIGQAATTLGVSEKTVRRRIKRGLLNAKLMGDPPHYEIEPVEIGIDEDLSSQKDQSVQAVMDHGHATGYNIAYQDLIDMLKEQLTEKDGQIKELHILLQGAQEQAGRMLTARVQKKRNWWWPFA